MTVDSSLNSVPFPDVNRQLLRKGSNETLHTLAVFRQKLTDEESILFDKLYKHAARLKVPLIAGVYDKYKLGFMAESGRQDNGDGFFAPAGQPLTAKDIADRVLENLDDQLRDGEEHKYWAAYSRERNVVFTLSIVTCVLSVLLPILTGAFTDAGVLVIPAMLGMILGYGLLMYRFIITAHSAPPRWSFFVPMIAGGLTYVARLMHLF